MKLRVAAIQRLRFGQGHEEGLRYPIIAFIGMLALLLPVAGAAQLAASVLPSSRSVQVGQQATAFATIINAGDGLATACGIRPVTGIPATFFYQTTDPLTNQITGEPDTPADIPAGGLQTLVFGFTPTLAFAPVEVELAFDCADAGPALSIPGVNTLLLSASDQATPDIVALAATPTADGIANIPNATGTGVFAVATVNVGMGASLDVTADAVDAGTSVITLLCETDPATGACINPAVPTRDAVTTSIEADETPTFGIFVQGQGDVPFDAIGNRVAVRFEDQDSLVRGSTSVAIRSVLQLLNVEDLAATAIAQFGTEVDATMVLLLAIDNGYSPRQIVDAVVAAWLTAEGDIVNSGGLVAPAGPALGVIVRSVSVASIRPLALRHPSLTTNQITEEELRAELSALRTARYVALLLTIVNAEIYNLYDPVQFFFFLIDFAATYDELVEEHRQASLPNCDTDERAGQLRQASLASGEASRVTALEATAESILCVTEGWLDPKPAIYRGTVTESVLALDPFAVWPYEPDEIYHKCERPGIAEIEIPADVLPNQTIVIRSDIISCYPVYDRNARDLDCALTCVSGALAEYSHEAHVSASVDDIFGAFHDSANPPPYGVDFHLTVVGDTATGEGGRALNLPDLLFEVTFQFTLEFSLGRVQ